jgi:hypothetical protein
MELALRLHYAVLTDSIGHLYHENRTDYFDICMIFASSALRKLSWTHEKSFFCCDR